MIRSSEFWGGLFWLAVGAFVIWAGRDLGIGKVSDPGSGFALFWIGAILVVFSAMIILASFSRPGTPLGSLWRDTRWGKVLIVVALLVAFGFLFETLGFITCSVVMLLVLMLLIDPVRWHIAIPLAVIAPTTIYFLVTKWLKVQMPTGVLAPWLG